MILRREEKKIELNIEILDYVSYAANFVCGFLQVNCADFHVLTNSRLKNYFPLIVSLRLVAGA